MKYEDEDRGRFWTFHSVRFVRPKAVRLTILIGLLAIAAAIKWDLPIPVGAWASTENRPPLSPTQLYELTSPAVVWICLYDENAHEYARASGFFISRDGHIATVYHVIKSAAHAEAILVDGRRVDVMGVVAADEETDLAILQADIRLTESLQLSESDYPEVGTRIYVLGAPGDYPGILTEGIVASDMDPASSLFSHSAECSGGSSGSPVFTSTGRVVGVHAASDEDIAFMHFAVPVRELKRLWNTSHEDTPLPLQWFAASRRQAQREAWVISLVHGCLDAAHWVLSHVEAGFLHLYGFSATDEVAAEAG